MDLEMVAAIAQQSLMVTWQVSYPVLMSGLLIGLLISIFQAVTQIHEMTLTFIPKILVAVLAVAITWDKMMMALLTFTRQMFTDWQQYIR